MKEKTFQIFFHHWEFCFFLSLSSTLPFSLLSFWDFFFLCLTKSLTLPGLPPVSSWEIQGLPEEQSQWQRPAAPRFHRKPPILPPPSSFRPVLFPRRGRGWGSNDGIYPSLSLEWHKKPLNIHSLFVLLSVLQTTLSPPPPSSFPCLLPFIFCPPIKPDPSTHTHTYSMHPSSLQSLLSPLNKSLQWLGGGGMEGLSLLHLSTNKPCCLTWQSCCWASHPSFPACTENRENNKVSLDPEWKKKTKNTQLAPHRECPQAQGVGYKKAQWKFMIGNCAKFGFLSASRFLSWKTSACPMERTTTQLNIREAI